MAQQLPRRGRLRRPRRADRRSRSASGTSSRTRPRAGSSTNGVAQGRPRRDRPARTSTACGGSSRTPRCTRPARWWCPANTRLSTPEMITILGHAEISVMFTCAGLLEHARAVRAERALAAIDRVRRRARRRRARLGRRDRRARRERHPGAGRRRRHRRHHVHVGHDRTAEGRARPAPQRRDDPELRAALDEPRLAARRAAVHVRGHELHLQPDEDGAHRAVHAEVRRRPLVRRRRDATSR